MRMRRVFLILALILSVQSVALAGRAYADSTFTADDVTLSGVTATPSALAGDGQVEVSMKVSVAANRAGGGITQVRVTGDGVVSSDTISDILIGEDAALSCTVSVPASRLGSQIKLKAVWNEYPQGLEFTFTVAPSAPAEPQVEFARTLDRTTANKGDTVAIVYTVENKGDTEITNLVVTDSGVGQKMGLNKSSLGAGDTVTFNYSYTVNADFTSSPKLTFESGGKTYTKTVEPKTVTVQTAKVEAVLEASPATVEPGGEVTLLCTLTNAGTVKMTSITIGEKSLGNKLFASTSLDAGASKQFSKKVTLTKTASFLYQIACKDENGQAYTFESNELTVNVNAAGGQYDIDIQASPDAIQLAEPGNVQFNITLNNKGSDAAKDVRVEDQDGKTIRSFGSLPVGRSEFTYDAVITQTTVFNFRLVVPLADGNYEVYTGPMEIAVVGPSAATTPTAAPTQAAASPAPTAAPSSNRIGALLLAMAIVGVLIVITIFVLIGLLIADRRKRKAAARR